MKGLLGASATKAAAFAKIEEGGSLSFLYLRNHRCYFLNYQNFLY
ncbi:hypothetical protein DOT_0362 [Desulfosporosinus sp. OT]|nr:hypothetical protein DOT_0362 [Desulfosporosinus sp. OT]